MVDEASRCNLYMHREALAWAPKKKRLPVTLVTGFLGSGKTTLLTHILTNKHNLKIAAAVNDFASLNIDGQIVRGVTGGGGVVELSNGCLCCSVSGEFKKAVWALLQDADIGKIDYLIVETSGVTDPLQTIATLEQEYGQMYRVRLDVVVTVVDSDDLYTKLQDMAMIRSVAADSQLKCADVILLNKKDLVSEEQLQYLKDYLSAHVPGVAIRSCCHGAVPLHWIMEVSEVSSGPKVVSHEAVSIAYTIGCEGGVKNVARCQRGIASDQDLNHLSTDEFQSLVFNSSTPFSLEKFQYFLGTGFPSGLVRMKGSVWFHENRFSLYLFHMSGRNRYELTPQTANSLDGALRVELVAIGTSDLSLVKSKLEECVFTETRNNEQRYREVCSLIEKHDYFVLESPQDGSFDYVDFRVSGCIDYGVTEEEASGFHGVNFSRMNTNLSVRVNGSSDKISLLPVLLPNGVQVCRHGVYAEAGFEGTWKKIVPIAEKIVSEAFLAVGVCKCGR